MATSQSSARVMEAVSDLSNEQKSFLYKYLF